MRSVYGAKMRFKEGRGSEAPVATVHYQPDYNIARSTSYPKAWANRVTARMIVGSDSHQFTTLASLEGRSVKHKGKEMFTNTESGAQNRIPSHDLAA